MHHRQLDACIYFNKDKSPLYDQNHDARTQDAHCWPRKSHTVLHLVQSKGDRLVACLKRNECQVSLLQVIILHIDKCRGGATLGHQVDQCSGLRAEVLQQGRAWLAE